MGLFELRRAEIAQHRMYPRPVVDDLDVLEQVQRGLLARGVGARVHACDNDFIIAADVDLDATQEGDGVVFANYRVGFADEL